MAGAGTYKNKVNADQNKLIEYAFCVCVCYSLTSASAPLTSGFSAISYLS